MQFDEFALIDTHTHTHTHTHTQHTHNTHTHPVPLDVDIGAGGVRVQMCHESLLARIRTVGTHTQRAEELR